jgi:hypothetical protein
MRPLRFQTVVKPGFHQVGGNFQLLAMNLNGWNAAQFPHRELFQQASHWLGQSASGGLRDFSSLISTSPASISFLPRC